MNLGSLPFIGATHRGPRRSRIRLVVMHSAETPETQTSAEGVARYFASGNTTGSAHLCFDSDSGVRCAWDEERTNGAGGVNDVALHVELSGRASQSRGDWTDPFSRATLVNAAGCVAEWCATHDIPTRKLGPSELGGLGICGHADVSAVYPESAGHWDPGPEFPWDVFIDMVNGAQSGPTPEQVAAFFRLLAALRRRKGQRMFLYQDSRTGAVYKCGDRALYLDGVAFGQVENQLGQSGQDNRVWETQDYMIDVYARAHLIDGEPAAVKAARGAVEG